MRIKKKYAFRGQLTFGDLPVKAFIPSGLAYANGVVRGVYSSADAAKVLDHFVSP